MTQVREIVRRPLGWARSRGLAWASRSGTFEKIVDRLERIGSWPPGTIAVLTYHRVDEPGARPDLLPGLISATPAEFKRQVEYLARRMRVVSIDELLGARRRSNVIPHRAVHLTVDDAYRDFAEHAWPVLRQYGLPVTMFVPTGYPDHPELAFWWDRLYAACARTTRRAIEVDGLGHIELGGGEAERLAATLTLRNWVKRLDHDAAMATVDRIVAELDAPPPEPAILGWDELRALSAEGVTVAPHSRTHPLLDRLAADRLEIEIAGSRNDLERETGSRVPVFAYPSGSYDDEALRSTKRAGIEIAFTTRRGTWDALAGDWLQVRRINVGRRSNLPIVRAQIAPAVVRLGGIAGGRR
jgi:peptidoglycan/xylan/chitin deacetylase (PgdA/CDA1 family)